MTKKQLKEYQNWAEAISTKIQNNKNLWENDYINYANHLIANEESYKIAKGKIRVGNNLFLYLPINVKENKKIFDIRYLGQSVGTLTIDGNNKPCLTIDETKKNKLFQNYDLPQCKNIPWSCPFARKFKKFFRDYDYKKYYEKLNSKEAFLESALYSELGKTSSKNKTLAQIQPIKYARTRIHMITRTAASKIGKTPNIANVTISSSQPGRCQIDCFCRRKANRTEARLVVIEIKDENKKKESYEIVMYQALTYAVFIRELLHSKGGDAWRKIWGISKQKKEGFIIEAVVAMPLIGESAPIFNGEKIYLQNKNNSSKPDCIELHYIGITSLDNLDKIEFESSF